MMNFQSESAFKSIILTNLLIICLSKWYLRIYCNITRRISKDDGIKFGAATIVSGMAGQASLHCRHMYFLKNANVEYTIHGVVAKDNSYLLLYSVYMAYITTGCSTMVSISLAWA